MGHLEDLRKAIEHAYRAVEITSQGHPELASRVNNLGNWLSDRYERTGNLDDLQEAVRQTQQAVNTTPQDHPDLASRLNNLGNRYSDRYERIGNSSDLQEAVQLAQQVVNITPQDHPDLALRLNNLGQKFTHRYRRTGDTNGLQLAIQYVRRAVNLTPENHPSQESFLGNLANMLSDRCNRMGNLEDLQKAICYGQRAVDATPKDHPDRATRLNNLGNWLADRYQATGNLENLQGAIQYAQEALDTTPDGHPHLASRLNHLAMMLLDRYERTHDEKDKGTSMKCFSQAFNCLNAIPLDRIKAARGAIKMHIRDHNLHVNGDGLKMACSLAGKALELLPLVCSRYLSRDDQQHAILQTSGLASEASSLLLQTSDSPERALEYLEHGRSLIIGYLADNRGDTSELSKKHPKKAEEFDQLRFKATISLDSERRPEVRRMLLQERDEAVTGLESCLNNIRKLDGFDRFLRPLHCEALQAYAADGPIIVVNITSISSDALIILPSGTQHLPLPDLQASKVEQYRLWGLSKDTSRLIEAKEKQRSSTQLQQLLRCLWSDCVRLVLKELGFLYPFCNRTLPRVWWIGTGLASSLPFHAAGDHSIGSVENAFSCVLSSYTPSIKMLK
jgi:acyl carrier protein phosphodiesterase